MTLELVDMNGVLVFRKEFSLIENVIDFATNNLPNGLYFYSLVDDQKNIVLSSRISIIN